jgi:hypothetical protein
MKYAALITTSITIPGDERSRTHPGHGYPEHSVDSIRMEEFADQKAMETWLANRAKYAPSYERVRLIRYEELKPTTTITVQVAP